MANPLDSIRRCTARGLSVLACIFIPLPCVQAAPPSVVTTFHSAGLYWEPEEGSHQADCKVEYREEHAADWKQGLNLWFDPRTPGYRGSVVGLRPGASYVFKLTLSTGQSATINGATWRELFPVGPTHTLPEVSDSKFTITQSGTPQHYVVYAPSPGSPAVIDVKNAEDGCIEVDASYVIIRGVTMTGGINHGVILKGNAHHVVIERCDISGFGEIMEDGWGREGDAAVFSEDPRVHNIVVQRCRIHHPRSDSNSWDEPRPVYKNNLHPQGPQAISFYRNNAGNNVFRYNEIYSDIDHMFNDGIGGSHNFSMKGFPGRDSDVYGNVIMDCWDNPIEVEGGGMNVRVWGNYIDRSYTGIATLPVTIGPTYVFRNFCNKLWKGHSLAVGQRFFKSGAALNKKASGRVDYYGDGRVYLFHNTMLQEMYNGRLSGGGTGLADTGPLTNYVTRNNIWYTNSEGGDSIRDSRDPGDGIKANSFDHDMYSGRIISESPEAEANGIKAKPVWAGDNLNMYDPLATGRARIALEDSSRGVDAAQRLPNFNDVYEGSGPDMGANERYVTYEFGVDAYAPREIEETPDH